MKNLGQLVMLCGGLGALFLFWGVMSVLGWFPVPTIWHSALIIGGGLLLLLGALTAQAAITVAATVAKQRGVDPVE